MIPINLLMKNLFLFNPFVPNVTFLYFPENIRKPLRFSDDFRRYRNVKSGENVLKATEHNINPFVSNVTFP